MNNAWKIKLAQADILMPDLAKAIGRSRCYMSKVINKKVSPTISEVYTICEILNIALTDLKLYF